MEFQCKLEESFTSLSEKIDNLLFFNGTQKLLPGMTSFMLSNGRGATCLLVPPKEHIDYSLDDTPCPCGAMQRESCQIPGLCAQIIFIIP